MELSLTELSIFLSLIFIAGFVDAIAGGGGLISVPAYIISGVPVEYILATNKTVSTSGASLAVFRYIKNKTIIWSLMVYGISVAFIFSTIGASLSKYISKDTMIILLLIITPLVFFLSLHKTKSNNESSLTSLRFKTILICSTIGFYDGIFGPGTGTFLLILFTKFLNFTDKEASSNARIINYSSNLAAFIYFLINGQILWSLAILAIVASVLGNWIGSGLVLKNASKIVKPMYRFVLVLLLFSMTYELLK
jgi:uncharacterized protein